MRRLTPTQIGLIIAGVLILVFVVWIAAGTRRDNPDRVTDGNAIAEPQADNPARRCGSQTTYDLIKRDLFRRASALRGSDQAAFDRIASYSVVRVDQPLLDSEDQQTGAIACSGTLTLDLPPGVAVVGGRRTLNADIGYTLQRSADGNGEVLTLSRADAIITPLATLARTGQAASDPLAPAVADTLTPEPAPLSAETDGPLTQTPSSPPPPMQATASPSFNCASARTRGEIAVCGDSGLASLDREMAAHYVDAMREADPGTRAMLQRSRDRFLGYRDQCPNAACIADTYRGRIREIRDIANGRLR